MDLTAAAGTTESIPDTVLKADLLAGPLLGSLCSVRAVFPDAFNQRINGPALGLADGICIVGISCVKRFAKIIRIIGRYGHGCDRSADCPS